METTKGQPSSSKKQATEKVNSQTTQLIPPPENLIKPAITIEELEKKKFVGPRLLDWTTLQQLNVHTQFDEWLTKDWKNLLSIGRPVYKELAFEFFSTYRFNKFTDNVNCTSALEFELGGKEYNLSFAQFAIYMNLYTAEEVKGKDFIYGLTSFPSGVSASSFWTTFGTGRFDKNMACTTINNPSIRILHRAIAETINQRGTTTNHVTSEDMFYLYCILAKKPCNLAKCLARYLYKSKGKGDKSAVCGGSFVTELAIGLGVVTDAKLASMHVLGNTKFFDEGHLKRMDLVEKDPPLRFVDPNKKAVGHENEQTNGQTVTGAQITWLCNAVHYVIQKNGLTFEAPPHLKSGTNNNPGNQAKNDSMPGAKSATQAVDPGTSRGDAFVGPVTKRKIKTAKEKEAFVDDTQSESSDATQSF